MVGKTAYGLGGSVTIADLTPTPSSNVFAERQDLALAQRLFQKVSPVLHHLDTRLQIERMIISSAHGVAGNVSQLQLDVLMKDRAPNPRKPCSVMRPLYCMRSNACRIVLLLIGFFEFRSPGESHSLYPVKERSIYSNSNA